MAPVLTLAVHESLRAGCTAGAVPVRCSLDLGRTEVEVLPAADAWTYSAHAYPYLESCKDRTIYYWTGNTFAAAQRYSGSLFKLVPTPWGAPTFEIDGIKMLPSARISPYADAARKVDLVEPRGKVVLDTCGGLGYFAAWCLERGAARVISFEKNRDVLWLRSINPWSPAPSARLDLTAGDVTLALQAMRSHSIDAVLHDPPRFGIAGELYSQDCYDQLARVLKQKGKLFHYTGTPNKLTSGRDVPAEVARRLRMAGFDTRFALDGVLAVKTR